ncbi:DivIVA domain-containing protein [Pseudonocardia lacus]|uniref:DivIVA domain-containing protein n=1 Tax=Pseudonocardia lacus TaxID=2835865 RepID=UPI001BDC34A1|nr:DivIVA domain-containing protein [Pseudonocardia lacus]
MIVGRQDLPVVESGGPAEPAPAAVRSAPGPSPAQPAGDPDVRRFDTVLRGYDPAQVDAHLARLAEENAALRRRAAEADRRRRTAEQHAAAAEGEFRKLQARRKDAAPEESFGLRAEKLMRLAEQDVADLRAAAAKEASAVVEAARVAADELRKQAEAAAEAVRLRAAQDAERLRERAQQDVTRLSTVQRDVRSELARLADTLAAGMGVEEAPAERRREPAPAPGR